jgi:hypothetical protein
VIVLHSAPSYEDTCGSGGIAKSILNRGTRGRGMLRYKFGRIHTVERDTFDRSLGGIQTRFCSSEEEDNLCPAGGNLTPMRR